MNLLWISHNVPYPPKIGVLERNYNLLREAAQMADVHLVALWQRNILPIQIDLDEARRALRRICPHVEILTLPTDSSPIGRYGLAFQSTFTDHPYGVNWLTCPAMRTAIRNLLARLPVDLVHFDTLGLAQYRADVGDIPKILNHHNIESQLMARRTHVEPNLLKKPYFGMEARKLARYETANCGHFDLNVTVSELDSLRLRALLPTARVEVIPNGVDTDYFCPDSENRRTKANLIFVGGMAWYPNRDAVLYFCREIWPLLTKEIRNISLTVVGGNPPRELVDLARTDRRVVATGFVDDVRPYLDSAEVYVCPMRDGGGTRLKILDALAMGKAIVSSSIGCEGIDVTPAKHVLLADTPEEFATEVKRVIDDSRLREMLGREGRRFVEAKYSWKVIGEGLRKAYRRVASLDTPLNQTVLTA